MSLVDEQLPLRSIIVVEEQLGLASKADELGSSCWVVWGSLRQKEYSSILREAFKNVLAEFVR